MEAVLDTYAQPHDASRPVICFGEKSYQWLDHVHGPLPPVLGIPARVDHEYKQCGTVKATESRRLPPILFERDALLQIVGTRHDDQVCRLDVYLGKLRAEHPAHRRPSHAHVADVDGPPSLPRHVRGDETDKAHKWL
ncbi:hypothetical protein M1R55_22380 (plasmid) [Deinococcus sp. QL22]|nr:hypothetical protein [Deinococcus sp. QL22]UQN09318.1 hypothetical protein M1R55_22380 [Deinococcus sp. QL22]